MEDVGTGILISEYYPNIEPPADERPVPTGRLTPFFHDFHFENVSVKSSKIAGVVFGLPEAPVKDLVMKNVRLNGIKGLTIGNARGVVLQGVTVNAAQGKGIDILPSAKVTMR